MTAASQAACALVILVTLLSSAPAQVPVKRLKTPDGVQYGVWGRATSKPAPTLFVLAGTIEGTLGDAYFRQSGNELSDRGYICVSIDLPCHGDREGEGEPKGLSGWSHRISKGQDIVSVNNGRLSRVLDHLIETGTTDPRQVAACGTSRGGFLAIHFAAHDSRIRCVAAFAPVTRLAALREFQGKEQHPLVKRLSLSKQAEKLAGRAVWIIIGDQDQRVGTDHAIELARQLTAASRSKKKNSRVELHVMPEPRGHTTPRGASKQAAAWIHRQLAENEKGATPNRFR